MIPSKGDAPTVALIGVNGYAKVYVEWLVEAQRKQLLKIAAVCVLPCELKEPAVAKFAELGAEVYDCYETMFAENRSGIDLCFIPTGIPWHARMTIAALQAGCNVLVEKPLAGSLQDALAVRETMKATGKWVAIGYQDFYTDEVRWLKESLASGAIGNLKSVSMLGIWPRSIAHYERNQWAGRLRADGAQVLDSPLNNAFSHFVNLSLYLAGATVETSSESEITSRRLCRARDIESFDTAEVSAKSPSGIEFWFGVSHSSNKRYEPTIRIEGTNGQATWTYEKSCSLTCNGETTTRRVPNYEAKREALFRSVMEKLQKPETKVCDPTVAICHSSFIDRLHDGATIKTVAGSEIEMNPLDENNVVPSIRGLAERLESEFDSRTLLKAIESQPSNV